MVLHITENWRGTPLISREVSVNLIANTPTQAGLYIHAVLSVGRYPTGLKVPPEHIESLILHPASLHGDDWNYTIKPSQVNIR